MKCIILAGGSGTRLYPLTKGVSKQLLPIYSKPMIYYPLSIAMLGGSREVLVITTPHDNASFRRLLDDGSSYGIKISYAIQEKPEGLAQSFLIAEKCGFLSAGEPCELILGDNIFHCSGLTEKLKEAAYSAEQGMTTLFGIKVSDPCRYGIVEIGEDGIAKSIEEKPSEPKSDICVTGLYFYPGNILDVVKQIKPSARGELEITSVNQIYLSRKELYVERLAKGDVWLDTGTYSSLSEASSFVEAIENRSGNMICCPEEIGYNNGWIDRESIVNTANEMKNSEYGKYLLSLLD